MDQDRGGQPSWLAWILTFLQALAFAVVGYLFQEIGKLQDMRERDMAEIRAYNMQNATWRGAVDAKVEGIREDMSDVRDAIKRRGLR